MNDEKVQVALSIISMINDPDTAEQVALYNASTKVILAYLNKEES